MNSNPVSINFVQYESLQTPEYTNTFHSYTVYMITAALYHNNIKYRLKYAVWDHE